jgi:hypothetical protein
VEERDAVREDLDVRGVRLAHPDIFGAWHGRRGTRQPVAERRPDGPRRGLGARDGIYIGRLRDAANQFRREIRESRRSRRHTFQHGFFCNGAVAVRPVDRARRCAYPLHRSNCREYPSF